MTPGSSPRMRGTRRYRWRLDWSGRIIPAHAGNSPPCGRRLPQRSDHPRACGELVQKPGDLRMKVGSSPRMRGTLVEKTKGSQCYRIIPAHAGNSLIVLHLFFAVADHPRACGELTLNMVPVVGPLGSSPRMRGTPPPPSCRRDASRIIPAHAGNSGRREVRWYRLPDHPRACGELRALPSMIASVIGSSPRMRGTRFLLPSRVQPFRIIPAHAGNSRMGACRSAGLSDHPRACGELFPQK